MGITGLLPQLKKATKSCHVRKFSGCTAAIDAYSWLHKGAFGCADKLGKGEPTRQYIAYCMKYIQVLLDNNVKPVLVLDGRNLPSKEHTEKKRREKRNENRKLARKYLQEGKKKEAWECFTKCVDITPAMAREFIKELREKKIDYVVAPYEADAQLAYLANNELVDFVITEDSDLVLFGCPRILFKMAVDGSGVLYEKTKLHNCWDSTPKKFRFDHFRWMCILSGCDYLASLPGIGLGRAKKVVFAANHDSITQMIETIPTVLDKFQVEITEEYIKGFIQAENTFLYQLVFDTVTRKLIPLNSYPDDLGPSDLPFAGSYDYKELATGLALGNVDLHSLKTVDNFDPLKFGYSSSSIWSPLFKPGKSDLLASKLGSGTVGMEMSVIKKEPPKKRPLNVSSKMKLEKDDNSLGDSDLMNLYGEGEGSGDIKREAEESNTRTRSTRSSMIETKTTNKVKQEELLDSDAEFNDSPTTHPSNNKRRRIMEEEKTDSESNTDAYSSNTRPTTRSRNNPFRKTPEKLKVHVKSKYFRSEPEYNPKSQPPPVSSSSKKVELPENTKNSKSLSSNANADESSCEDEEDDDLNIIMPSSMSSGESQGKLSIYSYSSNDASQSKELETHSDISASSQQVLTITLPTSQMSQGTSSDKENTETIAADQDDGNTEETTTEITKTPTAGVDTKALLLSLPNVSVSLKRLEYEEITLDDDDSDEAYGSASNSNSSGSVSLPKSSPSSQAVLSSNRNTASTKSSPYFSSPSPNTTANGKTRSSRKVKTTPPCRRVGLSRTASVKKDPKQRSVKDMFIKQAA